MIRKSKWKGYTAIAIGSLVGVFALWKGISLAQQAARGEFPTLGSAAGYLLRLTVVFYCAFIARRHLSSQPLSHSPWQSAGWARIVIGTVILAVCIQQFVWPPPGLYQPTTPGEAAGYWFAKVLLFPGLGLGLVVWGIARAFAKVDPA